MAQGPPTMKQTAEAGHVAGSNTHRGFEAPTIAKASCCRHCASHQGAAALTKRHSRGCTPEQAGRAAAGERARPRASCGAEPTPSERRVGQRRQPET